MLYELIGVVRPPRATSAALQKSGHSEIKEITRSLGSLILSPPPAASPTAKKEAPGVIRGITNWGTFLLPKPARKQGAVYNSGQYFIMRFDCGARTSHAVRRQLGLDPRMIRYSVVRLGDKLESLGKVGGKVEWPSAQARDAI